MPRLSSLTDLAEVQKKRIMSLHEPLQVIPSAARATTTLQSRAPGKVIVVLPAYNEGPNLGSLFSGIDACMGGAKLPYEVVLVDDGSSDITADVLDECGRKYPLTVLQHPQNCGLAETFRDGLLEALRRAEDTDAIVTMDADGTHIPRVILEMMALIEGGCDVVVASRFRPGATVCGVPAYRQGLSVGASWLCRMLFPTHGIRDFTCGYRAIRASVLKKALRKYGQQQLFDAHGFSCTMDLLLKLRGMKIVFGETPINLRYDLKEGKSKMHVSSTILVTLALMFRRRMGF
jgi:dolichol-phosphate mannosyltransferase